ncbi:hypothetical protein HDU93_004438, partial [Gonapodya sp. JEL0774]
MVAKSAEDPSQAGFSAVADTTRQDSAIADLKKTLASGKAQPRPRISATREESAALSDLAPKELEEKLFPVYIEAKYPETPALAVTE